MPISDKIKKKVNESEASTSEKNLMMQILNIEDRGAFRYQAEYESLIKKYIEENQEANN